MKSEKNKYHILMHYIENLEKLYTLTYLQGRNRDADVENGLVDMGVRREGEGETNWKSSTDVYTSRVN